MTINDFEILIKDKTKTDEEVVEAAGDVVIASEQDIHTFVKLVQGRPVVLATIGYVAKHLRRQRNASRRSKPIRQD